MVLHPCPFTLFYLCLSAVSIFVTSILLNIPRICLFTVYQVTKEDIARNTVGDHVFKETAAGWSLGMPLKFVVFIPHFRFKLVIVSILNEAVPKFYQNVLALSHSNSTSRNASPH